MTAICPSKTRRGALMSSRAFTVMCLPVSCPVNNVSRNSYLGIICSLPEAVSRCRRCVRRTKGLHVSKRMSTGRRHMALPCLTSSCQCCNRRVLRSPLLQSRPKPRNCFQSTLSGLRVVLGRSDNGSLAFRTKPTSRPLSYPTLSVGRTPSDASAEYGVRSTQI